MQGFLYAFSPFWGKPFTLVNTILYRSNWETIFFVQKQPRIHSIQFYHSVLYMRVIMGNKVPNKVPDFCSRGQIVHTWDKVPDFSTDLRKLQTQSNVVFIQYMLSIPCKISYVCFRRYIEKRHVSHGHRPTCTAKGKFEALPFCSCCNSESTLFLR